MESKDECELKVSDPIEVRSTDKATIEEIGRLRFAVWSADNLLDESLFPDHSWVDDMDFGEAARHWIVRDLVSGDLVGAARLTRHESLEDDYRDVKLWRDCGLTLAVPLVDFGRQAVLGAYRRRGIARALDKVRLESARTWDIAGVTPRCAVCTASEVKIQTLIEMGFFSIGQTAIFNDRPTTVFHALQCDFDHQ